MRLALDSLVDAATVIVVLAKPLAAVMTVVGVSWLKIAYEGNPLYPAFHGDLPLFLLFTSMTALAMALGCREVCLTLSRTKRLPPRCAKLLTVIAFAVALGIDCATLLDLANDTMVTLTYFLGK
jgi:hypothetical protein